jgi:hypothetical protein
MASEPQASVTSSLDAPRVALVPAAVRAWATAHETRTALLRITGYFALTRLTLFVIAACAIRTIPAGIRPPTEVDLGKNLSLTTGDLVRECRAGRRVRSSQVLAEGRREARAAPPRAD